MQCPSQILKAGCVIVLLLAGGMTSHCATYYTSPDGDDANPGTGELPWRTIQHAADSLLGGDTVIVREGVYAERITTVRAGAAEANRIVFQADGTVIVTGWNIGHAYVTIDGFEITGWSSADRNEAHVKVSGSGDYFNMFHCTMRDAIQITRTDMQFDGGSNRIVSPTGGFLSAGFASGQSVYVGAATPGISISNSGVYTITNASDTSIGVSEDLVHEGPLPVYLSAGYVFGLFLYPGTDSCVIRGNSFRNLGYDAWFILGNGHVLDSNIVEQVNGWDAMHFGGADHVFRRNVFRNSPLVVYQVSPDAWENYTPVPYFNVTFSNNFVEGFSGVMSSQKGSASSSGLILTHNVFVDVGRFNLTHPDTQFLHNTFLRVARVHYPVVSQAPHPIRINTSLGATNTVLLSNIFVNCGEPAASQTEEQVGWYEIAGPTSSVTAAGNFVAGPPPTYAAKTGWPEGNPTLNGGNPGFVNPGAPLGPDGKSFTGDDGLRLLGTAKLIDAAAGGATPGAYPAALVLPPLDLLYAGGNSLSILWSKTDDTWTLRQAPAIEGPWTDLTNQPASQDDLFEMTLPMTNQAGFFRLRY